MLLVPDAGGRGRGRRCCARWRAAARSRARPGPGSRSRPSYERALRALASACRRATRRTTPRSTWPSWCSPPTPRRWPTCATGCSRRWPALRPATAEKLAETLRAWLLHQGRRDDVAAALFVHPQTVRYRMGQLRELYGDRLDDPRHGAAS